MFTFTPVNQNFPNFLSYTIQGAPGGMCNTSGECSLC